MSRVQYSSTLIITHFTHHASTIISDFETSFLGPLVLELFFIGLRQAVSLLPSTCTLRTVGQGKLWSSGAYACRPAPTFLTTRAFCGLRHERWIRPRQAQQPCARALTPTVDACDLPPRERARQRRRHRAKEVKAEDCILHLLLFPREAEGNLSRQSCTSTRVPSDRGGGSVSSTCLALSVALSLWCSQNG